MRRPQHVVGVIERRDPIPPGVYWLDVFGDPTDVSSRSARTHWRLWAMGNVESVRILDKQEHFPRPATSEGWDKMTPHRMWVLFEVLKPTKRWPQSARLGLPTVAREGTKTTEPDTIQRPPPESPLAFLSSAGNTLGLLALLYLLTRK